VIPFFDLKRVIEPHREEIMNEINKVVSSATFINGSQVGEFERHCAEYLGVKHVIGVSSGTDALIASLMALDLKQGAEVIVTSFTFVATASSLLRLGLKPVFVDLEPNSFHPSLEQIKKAWTPHTKAVLFVHLFGEPRDIRDIGDYCKDHGAHLIEDCAQSFGARFGHNNRHVGTEGICGTHSFFPAKNLGCFGDAGAIATNNDALAEKIKMIRNHGCKKKYHYECIGGNFRIDTLQAAILNILLPHVNLWIAKRRQNASYYIKHLKNINMLHVPFNNESHTWNQFTLQTPHRDSLKRYLDTQNIGSAIYYPCPLHRQTIFDATASLPEVEKRCEEALSIPIYPSLQIDERQRVVNAINSFFNNENKK